MNLSSHSQNRIPMNIPSTQLIDEVGGLLESGVTEVFSTMLGMDVKVVQPEEIQSSAEPFVAASVGFVGDVSGMVYIYLRASLAKALAIRFLNLTEADADDDELTGDAIGELSNMIVGAAKSRLCDLGLACVLTIPSIMRGQGLSAKPVCSSESLQLTINCDGDLILVELFMKPTT